MGGTCKRFCTCQEPVQESFGGGPLRVPTRRVRKLGSHSPRLTARPPQPPPHSLCAWTQQCRGGVMKPSCDPAPGDLVGPG